VALTVVGGTVVVIEVDAAPNVGRTGRIASGSDEVVVEDVDMEERVDDGRAPEVVVEVIVICIEDVEVERMGGSAARLEEVLELEEGESVTVGLITTVAVEDTSPDCHVISTVTATGALA